MRANNTNTYFPSLSFSSTLRRSFRRSASNSTARSKSTSSTISIQSQSSTATAPPTVDALNSIMRRQVGLQDLEDERRDFATSLNVLEPRPVIYWGSLEERMGSL